MIVREAPTFARWTAQLLDAESDGVLCVDPRPAEDFAIVLDDESDS
jgi:hypothetical protein